jgi:hypothetical protein
MSNVSRGDHPRTLTSSLPVPMQLEVPKVDIPILMKIKHDQRTPQRRVENGKPQAQQSTNNSNHDHTVTASIDREVENKEREKENRDVIMIHYTVTTRPPDAHTVWQRVLLTLLFAVLCKFNHRMHSTRHLYQNSFTAARRGVQAEYSRCAPRT